MEAKQLGTLCRGITMNAGNASINGLLLSLHLVFHDYMNTRGQEYSCADGLHYFVFMPHHP